MALKVGSKVKAKDGRKGIVTAVREDGSIEVKYEDLDPARAAEAAAEKRRRENIAAGRHPLFISLADAPPRAATGRFD